MSANKSVKFPDALIELLPTLARKSGYENVNAFLTGCVRASIIDPNTHTKASLLAKLTWTKQDEVDIHLAEAFQKGRPVKLEVAEVKVSLGATAPRK